MRRYLAACAAFLLATAASSVALSCETSHATPPRIRVSDDGFRFICAERGDRFIAWGFNYDHDDSGRLLEDYWQEEWQSVVEDFQEMKGLGANLVRIHLQVARFMEAPDRPKDAALQQLGRLVELAETTGLYLDITGLACYHKQDVPDWYDALDESERWKVQALFWEAVAETCAKSDGYVGFYWGKTIDEYRQRKDSIAEWLEFFRTHGREILDEAPRARTPTD